MATLQHPEPLLVRGSAGFVTAVSSDGNEHRTDVHIFYSVNLRAIAPPHPDPTATLPLDMTENMRVQFEAMRQWASYPRWYQLEMGSMTLSPWNYPAYLQDANFPKDGWVGSTLPSDLNRAITQDILSWVVAALPVDVRLTSVGGIYKRCTPTQISNRYRSSYWLASLAFRKLSTIHVRARTEGPAMTKPARR
jgi:hypothetical protein